MSFALRSPTARPAPVTGTLLRLLAAQAAERRGAPAILAPGRSPLSYSALLAQVERAGDAFASMGLGRGDRIAMALPGGPDAAVALLAAMAWATAVPLDPRLDRESCSALFARLRVKALIVPEGEDAPALAAARERGLRIVRLASRPGAAAGAFALRAEGEGARVAAQPPAEDDIALVLHTSGTTAGQKVVALTHAQTLWSARVIDLAPDERCLGLQPLFLRSGIGHNVLLPLATGSSTVLVPGFDGGRFLDWLAEFRPTWYNATPAIHASVLDAVGRCPPGFAHSLRFVRATGAALPAAMRDGVAAALGVPVLHGYGSTEAGSIAVDPLPPGEQRAGSVGVVQNLEMRVLDLAGAELPCGQPGELVVRGPGVIRGYEDGQEADATGFVDGWWRTGDLGWLDADGYVYLVGRVDELINRGGVKVAPGEVDEVFARHPRVRETATVGIGHPSLGEDVVTAVVLREPGSIGARELREYALARLPPSKAPSLVVIVDDFPRNALGKVRRRALAGVLSVKPPAGFVAPRPGDQALVAAAYAAVLGLPRVGAGDHFFLLGGDSLRAMQVVARIAQSTGIDLPAPAVFEAPTVEELAQRLSSARSAVGAGRGIPDLARRR